MLKETPMIDATVFMGMHHQNQAIRDRSLAFFTQRYHSEVRMSFSQIGVCDAIIWKKARTLQDVYYPFMDVLHSDMNILRAGYSNAALNRAANSASLSGLSAEKRLQAAQVLEANCLFYTHDPDYLDCAALKPHLIAFDEANSANGFPEGLQRLYRASLELVITDEDYQHV
ncbi:DUF6190 family protein [Pseudomonas sp. KU26590]|uniref:DUF6190 family protein n=1 Tax=Pseudomonas sp. KU26590 TaxID=2991051 RepID=UPI00223D67B1|nr:DUF6190 family protein [Pseudomonas sp. KU26590]UZJ57843.1 DUF6190 family protein [Pseudomonas sp. KU26590]